MKYLKIFYIVLAAAICTTSCTKLGQEVYSVIPNQNFWQTPEQIAAGIAPAYASLSQIPAGEFQNLNEHSSDEELAPARGNDWLGAGQHIQMWTHTWTAETEAVVNTWPDLYNGIIKVNFTLSVVNNLNPAPPNLANINAELKTLRALYYYWAMDLYGNVPLVTDFATDPNTVKNNTRAEIYAFVEKELKDNINLISSDVSLTTYGRVTKWMSFSVLAKLYLNSGIYINTPKWAQARDMCDSIIQSGKYSLQPVYYDNFSEDNLKSVENIFVVPFDHVNIGGNNYQTQTLHYQNDQNLKISGGGWNGYCSNAEFYSNYDTTSVYTVNGQNTYRTFKDVRSGQFLIGQQFKETYTYPPSTNVLYSSTNNALKIIDLQTQKNLSFYANVTEVNNPTDTFRMAGLRNIKYFPNPGTQTSMSNDVPIFRLADILLMRAEASLRNGTATTADVDMVNQVRLRAYSGDATKVWALANLTLPNLLAERARELAWENHRRQDCIRFGTFGNARVPAKSADADRHFEIFPIPKAQHDANPNLVQNPGYPAF